MRRYGEHQANVARIVYLTTRKRYLKYFYRFTGALQVFAALGKLFAIFCQFV